MKSMLLIRVLALGLTVATFAAEAQTWPSKPLRVIVPIATGSMADIAGRVVFEQVSTQLGQPVIEAARARIAEVQMRQQQRVIAQFLQERDILNVEQRRELVNVLLHDEPAAPRERQLHGEQ